jgi:hypothetical protein
VVRTLEFDSAGTVRGDWRLASLSRIFPSTWLVPHSNYASDERFSHSLIAQIGSRAARVAAARPVQGIDFSNSPTGSARENIRALSAGVDGVRLAAGAPGDWSNDYGINADGAIFGMPSVAALGQADAGGARWSFLNRAFTETSFDAAQFSVLYSPNREMFSAIQFGSLLTGAASARPWQTLLFCPNSAATVAGGAHPGAVNPPDHLWADFFWMPIVDPYPVSEPFSTAGKVNLNHQIVPFLHIERTTGLYAVLKNMRLPALADSLATGNASTTYKGDPGTLPAGLATSTSRYSLDIPETLRGLSTVFDSGRNAFRSATQICEHLLVPQGRTIANTLTWWSDKRLTGDNTRESPYARILPRLTTKSNTFTVHLRVQALKQVPGWRTTAAADWGRWDETKDQVVSEYRGSASIERYVDPNDTSIPDFAQPANYSKNLAPYYRWRTLTEKQFLP